MLGFDDYRKATQKVVAVAWKDAHHSTDEVLAEDTEHRPSIYISAGVLLRSDAEGVTLSLDLNETGTWRGRTFIPREMVIEEWEVGRLRPKRRRQKPAKDLSKEPPLPLE